MGNSEPTALERIRTIACIHGTPSFFEPTIANFGNIVATYDTTIITFNQLLNMTPCLMLEALNKIEESHYQYHVDIYIDDNINRSCIKEHITQCLCALTFCSIQKERNYPYIVFLGDKTEVWDIDEDDIFPEIKSRHHQECEY